MKRPAVRQLALVTMLVLTLWACGSNSPEGPSPNLKTDTFTGTLNVGGSAIHPFTVSAAGTATLGLATLTNAPSIGMGLGVWDGSTCALQAATNTAQSGVIITLTTSGPQNLCASVFDRGTIASTATYTLQAVHP